MKITFQFEHIAEYILFDAATTLSNYDTARTASGQITADFSCAASLKTTAGQPGSLIPQSHCSAIEFDHSRPSAWDLVVPTISKEDASTVLKDCGYNACLLDASSKKGKSPKGGKDGKSAKDSKMKGKKSKEAKSSKSKSSRK